MPLKVQEISDVLDLVPVSKRDFVEHAVADAIGQGLDRLVACFQVFENKYANMKFHQAWLCALKQAILVWDSAEQENSDKNFLARSSRNTYQATSCKSAIYSCWLA